MSFLRAGEYTQMAGRAGRRGLDPIGTVIVACWEDIPSENELKAMLTGRGVILESQFRLTYGMLLNLLRVEDLKVEDMLKRSFAEFHAQKAAPQKVAALQRGQRLLTAYASRPWPVCYLGCSREDVLEYYRVSERIEELSSSIQATVMFNKAVHSSLAPGRAVLLHNRATRLNELSLVCGGPGMMGSGQEAPGQRPMVTLAGASSNAAVGPDKKLYVLSIHHPSPLDPPAADPGVAKAAAKALSAEFEGYVLKGKYAGAGANVPGPLPRYGNVGGIPYMVSEVRCADIVGICKAKIKVEPSEVLDPGNTTALAAALRALQKLQEDAAAEGGEPVQLDPRFDFKIADIGVVQAMMERSRLMTRRAELLPHRCPQLAEQFALVRSQAVLEARLESIRHQLSDASLAQMPEFYQRLDVLRRLEYVDSEDCVALKGRVACEINSTQDELVATEMVFSGLLADLAPEEAVALLSALVFQEKSEVEPALNEALAAGRSGLQDIVRQAAKVQQECGLAVVEQDYMRTVLHCGLIEVVYEWALGTPFETICRLTDVMEGSIVRCVVRLDQTCRELMDAARVMGNTALFAQMEQASALIKRDVVFAASLYVA